MSTITVNKPTFKDLGPLTACLTASTAFIASVAAAGVPFGLGLPLVLLCAVAALFYYERGRRLKRDHAALVHIGVPKEIAQAVAIRSNFPDRCWPHLEVPPPQAELLPSDGDDEPPSLEPPPPPS